MLDEIRAQPARNSSEPNGRTDDHGVVVRGRWRSEVRVGLLDGHPFAGKLRGERSRDRPRLLRVCIDDEHAVVAVIGVVAIATIHSPRTLSRALELASRLEATAAADDGAQRRAFEVDLFEVSSLRTGDPLSLHVSSSCTRRSALTG